MAYVEAGIPFLGAQVLPVLRHHRGARVDGRSIVDGVGIGIRGLQSETMEQPLVGAHDERIEVRESGRVFEVEKRAGKGHVVVESGGTDHVEPCALSPAVAHVQHDVVRQAPAAIPDTRPAYKEAGNSG